VTARAMVFRTGGWLLLVVALLAFGSAAASGATPVVPVPTVQTVVSTTRFEGRTDVLLKSIGVDSAPGAEPRVSCSRCLRYDTKIQVAHPARGAVLYRGVNWILQPGRVVSIRIIRAGEVGRYVLLRAQVGKRGGIVPTKTGCLASLRRVTRCPPGPSKRKKPILKVVVTPAGTPPPSLVTPSGLGGLAQQDQTLRLTAGVWANSTTQNEIWNDCNSAGHDCTPIPGQTVAGFGDSYVITAADVGHTIVVVETATGPGGSTTVDSAPTAVVIPPAPVNLTPPALFGAAQQGQTITLTYGTWAYGRNQTGTWFDCSTAGNHCTPIAGPTGAHVGQSYVITAADVGHTIVVVETATGPGGSTTVDSAPTAVVIPPAPVNLTPPALFGAAQQGQTITLTYGTWAYSTAQTGIWFDCDSAGAACLESSNQPPGDRYVLGAADVGHTIVLAETATGPGGSTTVNSGPTAVVSPAVAPKNLTPPSLHGTAQQGQTITLTYGTWAGSTEQAGTWLDCDGSGGACAVSSNQPLGDKYVLGAADVGHTIVFAETATGPGGSTTVDSEPTAVVT